jgi:hypothetical protein
MSLGRVTVTAERTDSGWSVSVELPDARLRPTREIIRTDGFPTPRPGSALATAAGDATAVRETLERFVLRDPSGEDVPVLGKYLFDALLGEDWSEIVEAAGGDGIEIALRSDAHDHELNRLPWELIHGPDGFLVGDPGRAIGITRLVTGSTAELDELPAALRVLFVIGTGRQDRSIRPGREYLMLVQRLEAQGVSFSSRVLVQATRLSLEDELRRWDPAVVHFICHGQFNLETGEARLALTSEEDPRQPDLVDAKQLVEIMRAPGRPLPQVVVLNACHSGEARATVRQQAVPMAAQLVADGIPMVVGMSGQVADRACRLFTRRFYEALLQGESVVAATAEGRRSGFTGADARRTVDWAFPTLFLSEGASPDVRIRQADKDLVARLHRLADSYRTVRNPRVFCDRFEIVEDAYHQLLRVDLPGGKRVLGVRVAHSGVGGAQFGKTRLLEELAARAAAEGFVPCLVSVRAGDEAPTALPWLGIALFDAMLTTRGLLVTEGFQVTTTPASRILDVLETYVDPEDRPSAAGNEEDAFYRRLNWLREPSGPLAGAAVDRKHLAGAVRADLAKLRDEVRVFVPNANVLVLVDEAHALDTAAVDFVEMLDRNGLGVAGAPVPVVFAFSTPQESSYSTAVTALRDFLEARSWAEQVDLGPFADPLEDPVPYQQFMLYGTDRPLVVSSLADPEKVQSFYRVLGRRVNGVPSKLRWPNLEIEAVLESAREFGNCLEDADDEDVLAELRARP